MHSKARIMENMTVEDVVKGLKKTKTVLVPLGVLEQHGYHLPLSTDIHNAWQLSVRVAERTGAFVAPSLNYAFSGGELPGTINISPLTMGLVVTDICQSLARQGFRNILLVLGHGGTENISVLKESLKLLLRRNPHLKHINLALVRGGKYSSLSKKEGKGGDFHAGCRETSKMLYWAPELVREKIVLDFRELVAHMMKDQDNYLEISRNVDEEEIIPFMRQRPDIKIGVMGKPEKATREIGKIISDQMVEGVSGLVERIEAAAGKAR